MKVWRWFDALFRRLRVRVGLESPVREPEAPAADAIAEIARQEREKARQRFESGVLFDSNAATAARGGAMRHTIVESRPGAPDAIHQLTLCVPPRRDATLEAARRRHERNSR
ncbi:MAG: hypothetical protein ABI693_02565 [Bryobacteraceae bacterium]